MQKFVRPASALLICAGFLYAEKFMPPPTKTKPVTEILHGVKITDPYRWLEDQNSPETRAWLEAQEKAARTYLDALPGRSRASQGAVCSAQGGCEERARRLERPVFL